MARITRHRRYPDRYSLAIARPDLPDREFTWAPDPPEGMTRAAYETMMQREAVLLVVTEAQQRAVRDLAGTKIAGEGTDVQEG